MSFFKTTLASCAAAALLTACAGMQSSMSGSPVRLGTSLSGAQEVPAVSSSGSGSLDATFDRSSRKLTYQVTYSGLSGPATAAHFHGPAAAGQNAGVQVPIASPASPMRGEATLTEAQAADLMAGRWYVNVHTAAFPNGEIRGQVMPR
jgi:hypothetical protein